MKCFEVCVIFSKHS